MHKLEVVRVVRECQRFGIALPITMEDGEGETLDISETGILFETAVATQPQLGAASP